MMTMATRQAPTVTRVRASCYMLSWLFFIITVATVSTPALAGHSSPPSTLVLYGFYYNSPPGVTSVEVASPSGNLSTTEFGTTIVLALILRETPNPDSPVVGFIAGQAIYEKDFSVYQPTTYVLNTTSFSGSISAQGVVAKNGEGEEAITGGTYDFRWAKGYVDITLLSRDSTLSVGLYNFTIKYD